MAPQPLPGAPRGLGARVPADADPAEITRAIFEAGFAVIRVGDLSGPQLSAAFAALFPSETVSPIGWFDHQAGVFGAGNLNLDRV